MNAEPNIEGMTVNERLFHFGLFQAFDAAVQTGELEKVVAVLMQAKFSREVATGTATQVLGNPKKYGH